MHIKSIAIIEIFWCGFLMSCGKDSSNNTTGSATSSATDAASCTPFAVPDAPPAAGQLTFLIPSDIDPCSVRAFVVGYKDQLKSARGDGGKFFINNVPAGSHDVIVVAGTLAVTTLKITADPPDRGIRLKAERILAGLKTEKDSIDLPTLANISGTVKLDDQADHAGIDLYIPGTSFLAKSDSNGQFRLSGVPAGEHNLYFEKDGYKRSRMEGLIVDSGTTASPGGIILIPDTGSEGEIVIDSGATTATSATVALSLNASDDAVLMRISESDVFKGSKWVPYRSTSTFAFDNVSGARTLFVQYANANGLATAAYSADIFLDLSGLREVTPDFDGLPTYPQPYYKPTMAVKNPKLGEAFEIIITRSYTVSSSASGETFNTVPFMILPSSSFPDSLAPLEVVLPPPYGGYGVVRFNMQYRNSRGVESLVATKVLYF